MQKSENGLGFSSCYKFPFRAFSACARYKSVLKEVHGLKQNRWLLAWVEQSHLSNLSILYGEWSEPCTRVAFCVLLSRDLMAPPPPTPPPLPHTHTQMDSLLAGCLRWIKDNDHKNEFCHFLYTKPALSRSPAITGIWTGRFWSTWDSLVEDIRNAAECLHI